MDSREKQGIERGIEQVIKEERQEERQEERKKAEKEMLHTARKLFLQPTIDKILTD